MSPEDIQNEHEFSQTASSSSYSPRKIKVIGVGGGGGNAINHMYNMGVRNVTFIIANTDKQALINSPVPTKVLLGPNVTKGRGAGNVPDKARMAAEESAEDINDLFDDDTDMVFITAGMGGGTGTGASPVIARIAHERGILTIGIVTIPFLFEGPKKILKALDGANEMSRHVDALLVINNERLSEIYKDYDFINAFGKADDILSMAAMSISEIVTCDGYINLDFNDVDNTLRDGGTAIISTGYGEGENRVTKAIEDALNSPLLRNTDIFGSKKLLFNLYFSRDAEDKFKIDETNQITSFISNIDSDVDVIWGVAFDETLGNKVKFTILAAGFDVTVNDNASIAAQDGKAVASSHPEHRQKPTDTSSPVTNDPAGQRKKLIETYGSDKVENMERSKNEQRYIVLQPDQLDDDRVLDVLENHPALGRDKQIIASLKTQAPATRQPVQTPPPASTPKQSGAISFDDID